MFDILNLINTILPVLLSLLAGIGMMLYLNHTSKLKRDRYEAELYKYRDDSFDSIDLKLLSDKISVLEGKIETINYNELNLKDKEKLELIESIKKDIISKTSDSILQELSDKIETYQMNDKLSFDIKRSIERLKEEKNSLFKRGNFNLVIGVMISGLGGYIAYLFIQKLPITGSGVAFLSYSLPRISLFMLIALLVFFFLNLYKRSLDDIKYYQNEMTNLEAKYLSLQIAKQMNNHKMLCMVLDGLIKTERNFILEKGQSTVEIEKNRNDSNAANRALETVKDIFKYKK